MLRLLLTLACMSPLIALAQADRFADVVVTAEPVSGAVHMLTGAGGNIAVSIGDDGTLIVDDQYAEMTGRIEKAIEDLGGAMPKIVINTHYHGDHTGGNAYFGKAGTIIAHDNVRARLLAGDAEPTALPIVTFDDRINVHFNGDLLELIALPSGHTDSDLVVWFKEAGIVHMGDHFFNGAFPFIDIQGGGSIEGYVQNMTKVIDTVPEDTRVIPGHGPLTDIETLTNTQNVIRHAYAMVRDGLDNGHSEADIEGALNAKYPSWGRGFISAGRWIQIVKANLNR